jgi:V/A-type H+-transporting ATPase subunit I
MAVLAVEKVQILGMKKDLNKVLNLLQKKGVMEVREITESPKGDAVLEAIEEIDHDSDYVIANTDFAIKALSPYAKKRPVWAGKMSLTSESALGTVKSFDYKKSIKNVQAVEARHVAANNAITALDAETTLLNNWKNLKFNLNIERETKMVRILTGEIGLTEFDEFKKTFTELSQLTSVEKINEEQTTAYIVVAVETEKIEEAKQLLTRFKFNEIELPSHDMNVEDRLSAITTERKEQEAKAAECEGDYKELGKDMENLQIVHDVFVWQQEEQRVREKLKGTTYSFVVTGWIAELDHEIIEKELSEISNNTLVHTIKAEKGEEAPIILRNSRSVWPFESVTKLYGFPMADEIDPTPLLAIFFIVFFALCLTDAGYGLMLFLIMAAALKFLNLPKENTGLIKLLMWGGILTMVAGVLFGGYFGLSAEEAPGFMVSNGSFKGQILNPGSGNGPLIFLVLALALGAFQQIIANLIDGYWNIKQKRVMDAILDSFLAAFILTAIVAYAVIGGLSGVEGSTLNPMFGTIALSSIKGGFLLLFLTGGRKEKSIIMKIVVGLVAFYNFLVGYLADILSYARIMALGLATGVIAFAMNQIAKLAYELIPVVGVVVAIVVIVVGHVANLVLSGLGAFIHSARLQFVEFFGKFMQGGGIEFRPFKRNCKYIVIN